jgi:hypothetical protein
MAIAISTHPKEFLKYATGLDFIDQEYFTLIDALHYMKCIYDNNQKEAIEYLFSLIKPSI